MYKSVNFTRKCFIVGFLCLALLGCRGDRGNDLHSISENMKLIDSLQSESEDFFEHNNPKQAIQIAEFSYILAKKENHFKGLLTYKKLKALEVLKSGKYKEAIELLKQIALEKTADDEIVSDVYRLIGEIYSKQNLNPQLGYNYLLKSIHFAELSKKESFKKMAYLKVGKTLFESNQFEESRKFIRKSLNGFPVILDSIIDLKSYAELNIYLGAAFVNSPNLDSAKFYLDKGSFLIEKIPVETPAVLTLKNMEESIQKQKWISSKIRSFLNLQYSTYFFNNRDYEKSSQYLNLSYKEQISNSNAEPLALFQLLRLKGEIALQFDSLSQIPAVLSRLEKLKDSTDFPSIKSGYYKLSADYNKKIGNDKLALEYFSKFTELGLIYSVNVNPQKIQETETNSELIEKGDEIKKLFAEKEAEQEKTQNLYTLAILALVIVLIVIFWLLLYMRSNRRLRLLNKKIIGQKQELEDFQKEMETSNSELEILNKEKTHILGVVAHDLRNPIDGIEGIVYLLRHETIYKNANGKKMIDYMQQLCEKARKTIADLIEVAQMNSDEEIPLETKELNSIISDSLLQLEKVAEGKGIAIITEIPEEKVYAKINEPKFIRVIDNLLTNAIKFTNKGGEIRMSLIGTADEAIFKIQDNGIGMPPEMIKIIFDRFTKAGRQGTRGEKSLGLGMSIVKGIIDKHEGKIDIQSEENIGTTVAVSLQRV